MATLKLPTSASKSTARKRAGGEPQKPEIIAGSEQFQNEWSRFIHRVKVHELLRCLENEQKKLKLLREHGDLNDIFEGVGLGRTENERLRGSGSNIIHFSKSSEQAGGKLSATSSFDDVQSNTSDFASGKGSAMRLFKTKDELSDEQFEQILQLCKDRVEQKQLRDAYQEKKYREKYLHNANERRTMLYEFINNHIFNRFLLVLITLSTSIIVALTVEFIEIRYSFPLQICDSLIIGIFLVEACCKISIYKTDYFKSLWNLLDLGIIMTHFIEVTVDLVTKLLALNTNISRFLFFRLLKSLRSLRLLRTIKFLPNLQVIVSTIFQSMLSMSSIATLMAIIMIVFAVVGRGLFKEADPSHFDSIWTAMLTLFQLLTLDDWFDLPDDYDTQNRGSTGGYVTFLLYLFIYIVFEYFVFLNLFVAVLVDNFQLSLEEAQYGETKDEVDFNAEAIGLAAEEEKAIDKSLGIEDDIKFGADLGINDYYGLDPNADEMKLMAENLKILNAIDFEFFLFSRRMNLSGIVLDAGAATKQNSWSVQDAIDYRFGEDNGDEIDAPDRPAQSRRKESMNDN